MRVLLFLGLSHVISQEVGYNAHCEFAPVVQSTRGVEDSREVMVVCLL